MSRTYIVDEPVMGPYAKILQGFNIRFLEQFLDLFGQRDNHLADVLGIIEAELVRLVELIHERHPDMELPPKSDGPKRYMGYRIK